MSLKLIKEDIEQLHQDTDSINVDILDLVEAFEDYEITERNACKLLHVESVDDIEDLEYETGENSYNWGGMSNHDFNYYIYKTSNGNSVISWRVHRFGDIRGNYTETAFLLFDDNFDFHEIINEQFHNFSVKVDGLEFSCTSRIVDEYVRCSAKTDEGYIDLDVLAYDMEDVKKELIQQKEVA